jgi:hypothetical protein
VTRKRDLRQRVKPEDADLEHLGSSADRRSSGQAPAIGDAHDRGGCRLRHVIDAQQLQQLDAGADLLQALADRCHCRVLVVVDEAAGQAPLAVARLDRSPAEDDATLRLDHHGGGDLRVSPEHEVVVGTRLELATFDDPRDERPSAPEAEVRHRSRA